MVAISQTIFFICIFVNEKFSILIKFSLKFVRKGLIDNIQALRRIGDKTPSEPMLTRFTEAYMRN